MSEWIKFDGEGPGNSNWCVVSTEYGYYVQCWSDVYGWMGDDINIPTCDVTHWKPKE